MTDPVDITAAWAGEKGRYWAEHADGFSALLADFGDALVAGAAFAPGERVLDVGCGGGDVALAAAGAVGASGSVLGVDVSADELAVARRRAAARGVGNVEFRLADAGREDLGPDPVDVLTSRFGVMFFPEPEAAFAHLHRHLDPGGRLAFLCWRASEDNEWLAVPWAALAEVVPLAPPPPPGAPGPSAFGDPDRVTAILEAAGFTHVELAEVRRPVHLGSVDEAVGFIGQTEFVRATLGAAPPDRAEEAVRRLRAALAERQGADGIDLEGRAWLVRARP